MLERAPAAFETSLPGVFAAGDVRAGSVKRVAAAAGEGRGDRTDDPQHLDRAFRHQDWHLAAGPCGRGVQAAVAVMDVVARARSTVKAIMANHLRATLRVRTPTP